MKSKLTIRIGASTHRKYKNFCRKNGLIISKRLEDLMKRDLSEILIGLPKVKL